MKINNNSTVKASLAIKTWSDIRDRVIAVNPKLGEIIDAINPDKKFKLYLLRCPFGSEILKQGVLHLPNQNGDLVKLNSPEISENIKQDLGYNLGSNPVTLVLKNSVELFMHVDNRIISCYGVISPGKIFSLWRVLNPTTSQSPEFIWEMTAGARSLFMLSKISSSEGYRRFKTAFNTQIDPPTDIQDHWRVFKTIDAATAHSDKDPWTSELLFFSAEWFKHLKDPSWLRLHTYLLETAWKNSEFWRNEFIWDMVFAIIHKRRNIPPDPHVNNTVRHLFSIGVGGVPGFSVAIDNSAGPIKKIQEIFSTVYNVDYMPIMMQPNYFSLNPNQQPVYYSLSQPTFTGNSTDKPKTLRNKINELDHIQYVFEKIRDEFEHLYKPLNLHGMPYEDFFKFCAVEFFHRTPSTSEHIKPITEILNLDYSLLASVKAFPKKPFPQNSPFLSGCIVLRNKKIKSNL